MNLIHRRHLWNPACDSMGRSRPPASAIDWYNIVNIPASMIPASSCVCLQDDGAANLMVFVAAHIVVISVTWMPSMCTILCCLHISITNFKRKVILISIIVPIHYFKYFFTDQLVLSFYDEWGSAHWWRRWALGIPRTANTIAMTTVVFTSSQSHLQRTRNTTVSKKDGKASEIGVSQGAHSLPRSQQMALVC